MKYGERQIIRKIMALIDIISGFLCWSIIESLKIFLVFDYLPYGSSRPFEIGMANLTDPE